MRKINNYKLILFIVTISLNFLSLFNGEVLAKTLPSNSGFTGTWQGKARTNKAFKREVGNITLTLCAKNGELNGTINLNQQGVDSNASIIQTDVISKKEVIVFLNDTEASILRLTTDNFKELKGFLRDSFKNRLVIFARKVDPNGCSAPSQPGGQQDAMSSSSTSSSGQQGNMSSSDNSQQNTQPIEAINACSGEPSGSSCSFSTGGNTVFGTCFIPSGQNMLSCIP